MSGDESSQRSLHWQLAIDAIDIVRDDPSIVATATGVAVILMAASFAPAYVVITETNLIETTSVGVLAAFGAMQLAWVHVVWSTFERLSGGGV